ncbi:MAG: hypothetical protein ABJF10_06085 [Chthoniobacter sp.]|uniref:hypothetical protein n=1 Tax=Chthoniobacter sp. TaxID=2510640 RepID=UPI0032ABD2A7
MKFSPDLTFRVADSLQRWGYCIFGINELERLFGQTKDAKGRMRLLEEFADVCRAKVETTPHFKSARFTKATVSESSLPAGHPGAMPDEGGEKYEADRKPCGCNGSG